MASASQLYGLMKFLKRDEWREPFEEIRHGHLYVACHITGVEIDELEEILGPVIYMNVWGCIFEDFLARDLVGDRNMIDDYLRRRSYKESASAKAYMKAIRTSVMSLYEVSELEPGQSFLARDLIRGGKPVRVTERTASAMLSPWDRIGARIIRLGNAYHMCGGVLLYDFETADKVQAKFRWFEGRIEKEMQTIAAEVGSSFDSRTFQDITAQGELLELAAPIFTRFWLIDALEKALNPSQPDYYNADGDPIMMCTLRFRVAEDASFDRICSLLAALPEMHQENETFFNWLGPEAAAKTVLRDNKQGIVLTSTYSEGGAILGSVEIKPGEVMVMTNSRERAEKARGLIGSALAPFAERSTLEIETLDEIKARRDTPCRERTSAVTSTIPQGEKQRMAHTFLEDHYCKTLDEPIPALGNVSPREAAASSEGREQVIAWLKVVENRSHRSHASRDPISSYDFDWMWSELGIERL